MNPRHALLAVLALIAGLAGPAVAGSATAAPTGFRDVMWAGNNWDGTATIIDERSLKVLKTGVNLIPDKQQEIQDILLKPDRLAFYLLIQQGVGEGHDQYVDDMFTTKDGKHLAVSRPSFGDVVWIDIAKVTTTGGVASIVREQQMDGYRTDHMGVSPDGRRLIVSDSTQRQAIEYSMVNETVGGKQITMGDRIRTFPSGEAPHENNYSKDGKRIFHASIGRVYTPGDSTTLGPVKIGPLHDALKGDRWMQIVNNKDFTIAKRWQMAKELAEAGHPDMSAAVRPMAISPDERFLYFQVSYYHGIVEFDTQAPDANGKVDYTAGGIDEPAHWRRQAAHPAAQPRPGHAAGAVRQRLCPPRTGHGRGGEDPVRCRDHGRLRRDGRPQDRQRDVLRHSDHWARLREAVLVHRRSQQHVLGLTQRVRLARRARLQDEEGAGLPPGRQSPTTCAPRLDPDQRHRALVTPAQPFQPAGRCLTGSFETTRR